MTTLARWANDHNDMDTYSASAVARMLFTSTPRVLRAIRSMTMPVPTSTSGAYAITPLQLDALRAELVGPTPVGLNRVQSLVLAALARSPRGLASIRSVARRAGVSPTTAGRALDNLAREGLVRAEKQTLALGRAAPVLVYSAAVDHPRWHELAPALAKVSLPQLPEQVPAQTVPYYLRHLFWNTAKSQLDVTTSAPFIAKRLLSTGDLDGLAWGAIHLPTEAWERAAHSRGISPRDRALARNLARRHSVAAKVQFLHADEVAPQRLLAPPIETAGLRVAELDDLLAMKLKVVGDRGELRDYFDLMTIEQRTGRSVEEGLQLFVARFQPPYPQEALGHIVRGLGYFDDVEPDDQLPVSRQSIVDYWTSRHPSVIAALGRIPP
jgi:DNA-binding Lrp family transcriptional regulator